MEKNKTKIIISWLKLIFVWQFKFLPFAETTVILTCAGNIMLNDSGREISMPGLNSFQVNCIPFHANIFRKVINPSLLTTKYKLNNRNESSVALTC